LRIRIGAKPHQDPFVKHLRVLLHEKRQLSRPAPTVRSAVVGSAAGTEPRRRGLVHQESPRGPDDPAAPKGTASAASATNWRIVIVGVGVDSFEREHLQPPELGENGRSVDERQSWTRWPRCVVAFFVGRGLGGERLDHHLVFFFVELGRCPVHDDVEPVSSSDQLRTAATRTAAATGDERGTSPPVSPASRVVAGCSRHDAEHEPGRSLSAGAAQLAGEEEELQHHLRGRHPHRYQLPVPRAEPVGGGGAPYGVIGFGVAGLIAVAFAGVSPGAGETNRNASASAPTAETAAAAHRRQSVPRRPSRGERGCRTRAAPEPAGAVRAPRGGGAPGEAVAGTCLRPP
jgi:hypothetical protein